MNKNPFLNRQARKQGKSAGYIRAPKQEKETAKRLGGHTTVGSGSKTTKGDVTVKNLARVELKCTSNKSFPVTLEMIGKIKNAAFASNQIPYIEVEFLGAYGKRLTNVAVIQVEELEILLNRMRDAETETETLRRRIHELGKPEIAEEPAPERRGGRDEQHNHRRAAFGGKRKLPTSRFKRNPK